MRGEAMHRPGAKCTAGRARKRRASSRRGSATDKRVVCGGAEHRTGRQVPAGTVHGTRREDYAAGPCTDRGANARRGRTRNGRASSRRGHALKGPALRSQGRARNVRRTWGRATDKRVLCGGAPHGTGRQVHRGAVHGSSGEAHDGAVQRTIVWCVAGPYTEQVGKRLAELSME